MQKGLVKEEAIFRVRSSRGTRRVHFCEFNKSALVTFSLETEAECPLRGDAKAPGWSTSASHLHLHINYCSLFYAFFISV